MAPSPRTTSILVLASVVAAVGVVDTILGEQWDLLAVFGLLLILNLALLAKLNLNRPAVSLRRDLVTWIAHRATVTGEPFEAIVDRAVAAYRSGLTKGV